MIRLPAAQLPARASGYLTRWQGEIDALPQYGDRVAAAKQRFSARNKKGNRTFDAVKVALTSMCQGGRRCVYCEDSVADEVEHIAPKDLYPDKVFQWENYVYACGPCNGPKNARFGVITDQGALVEVTRASDAPVVPPEPGAAALIDPRAEDPTALLFLDLETLGFTAVSGLTGVDALRAECTIDILRLSPGERDYLSEAWVEALGDFIARLAHYINRRDAGAPATELTERIEAIRRHRHPTVWFEMKRQRAKFAELEQLFAQAPEALQW